MTLPKNDTFVIHFEDRRGSRVNAAADQYLLEQSGQSFRHVKGYEPSCQFWAGHKNLDRQLLLPGVFVHLQGF